MLGDLWIRFRALFRRNAVERELDRELRFHFERQVEKYVQAGLLPEEARRRARLEFGGLEQVKEECREARGVQAFETLWQDLRYGARMLRRNPGFALLAILCLTLGIGANAAVFSWVEGILLRPFPAVAHQERLYALTGTARNESGQPAVSWPDFLDLQRNCRLIDAFIGDKIMSTTLSVGDRAQRMPGSIVSANYFDAIGVHPILGRGFEPGEDSGRNAHPVTVISYQLWKEQFHGDPAIIGKTQVLNGVSHTIIGVAPEGFYGTFVGWAMQFWVPASMEETFEPGGYKLEDRGARWIEGFVRLKPGVSQVQAQQELSAIGARLEVDYPATNRGRGFMLWPLWETPFNNAGTLLPMLGITLAVVVFVLLIACANVANLLLVKCFARRREMTVRLAIGAGGRRLARQLLTEGLLLSSIAAAGGVAMAVWCRHLLVLFVPSRGGGRMYLPAEIDWRVVALSAAICLATTLLIGLAPALQAGKIDLAGELKSEAGGVVGGRGKAWVRSSLVIVQVSLSFVLLVGAGLLVQSLARMRSESPGFSTRGVETALVDLTAAGYDARRAMDFQNQLIARVQGIAGVQSAAYAQSMPFTLRPFSSAAVVVEGYVAPPYEQPVVEYNEVGPGYLATMGIPVVAGREFTLADNETGPPVAVVSQKMAQQFWRGKDPVGQRMQVKGRWMRVVGIAKDAKYDSMREVPKPFFYVPLRQNFSKQAFLVLRTPLEPAAMAAALGREIQALDPKLARYEVITTREVIERSASPQRAAVTLLELFGGLALLLAAIGLYGVMSYAVSQSRRELGLRIALGARSSDLLWLVVSQGLALTAAGIGLGAAAALGLTRLIGNLLFQVSPRDPVAFGSALLVMGVVSLAACVLPAWRAARTDPMAALRHE
ncbi:MAG TPA: ABC transporter permease [Candidatus Acidoferrales bacterium]|nr:ABC transporter permease [Candidatus Acidoferrales bacterium]